MNEPTTQGLRPEYGAVLEIGVAESVVGVRSYTHAVEIVTYAGYPLSQPLARRGIRAPRGVRDRAAMTKARVSGHAPEELRNDPARPFPEERVVESDDAAVDDMTLPEQQVASDALVVVLSVDEEKARSGGSSQRPRPRRSRRRRRPDR